MHVQTSDQPSLSPDDGKMEEFKEQVRRVPTNFTDTGGKWPPKTITWREPGYETSTVLKWDEAMRRQKLKAKRLKAKKAAKQARKRNRR